MDIANVVVIKLENSLKPYVESIESFNDSEVAESAFLDQCHVWISNFNDYKEEDIRDILDDGIAEFGNGSICLSHSFVSIPDDLIAAIKSAADLLENAPYMEFQDMNDSIKEEVGKLRALHQKYMPQEKTFLPNNPMTSILTSRLSQMKSGMIDDDQFVFLVMEDMLRKGADPDEIFKKEEA